MDRSLEALEKIAAELLSKSQEFEPFIPGYHKGGCVNPEAVRAKKVRKKKLCEWY